MKTEELIRAKRPSAALEADHRRSRAKAIHLNCIACCAGSRSEVVACRIFDCFLWPFRADGADDERPEGVIPGVSEYERMIVENAGGEEKMAALRSRGRKLFDRQLDDPEPDPVKVFASAEVNSPKKLERSVKRFTDSPEIPGFSEVFESAEVTRPVRPVRKATR